MFFYLSKGQPFSKDLLEKLTYINQKVFKLGQVIPMFFMAFLSQIRLCSAVQKSFLIAWYVSLLRDYFISDALGETAKIA
jgi:hypothetical protein